MKNIFISLLVLLTLTASKSFGQISFSSYSSYAIGLNTDQNKSLSFELKTFTNRNFDDLLFEVNGYYNFKHATYHNLSIGLGLNMQTSSADFMNAVTLPFVIEVFPFSDFKKLSIVFEISPEYYLNNEEFNLRHLWGLRYNFGNKDDK